MGRLRLELDIDADVYPELHATLTSLVSDASRGERLRQLAAAGLVWEKLRIRGHAALHGVAPETAAVPAAPAAALAPPAASLAAPAAPLVPPAPAPRAARSGSGRGPAAARVPAPVPVPAAPPRPAPPGFIDLALDAAPEPLPPPPPASHAPAAPAPAVAQHWPPVLMDVVEPAAFTTATPIARTDDRPSRPMPLAPVVQPPPPPTAVRVVEEVHQLAPPEPDPPIEHRSSTRSRLLRMKEKGLFKNG